MRKSLFFSAYCILSLFLYKDVMATHAAGGELTYTHVSGNTYEFTFKFFRDCSGQSAPSSIPLCIYNICNNSNVSTVYLPQVVGNIPGTNTPNGSATSTGCPGSQTSCQNPASQVAGYAEWWYRGTYTLPAPGTLCDEWRFSTYIGNRNPSTNITGTYFYVEAYLNRRPDPSQPAINNNSPYFTNAPIPYYCANQPNTFNNGTQEIDGDSLNFYSIIPYDQFGCTHLAASTCLYSDASYNATTNPFNTNNTFNVNPTNGSISFTPNGVQIPTLSVRVDEYRNGVLIGYVMRDIQMVILSCTSPNPTFAIDTNTLSGGVQNANGIDLCHGQNFSMCFDVASASPTAVLTVSDNSQSVIPASNMNYTGIGSNAINGCFNWTPTLADTGLHILTITATDSTCITPGILISQTFTVALNVYQSFPLNLVTHHPLCGVNNGSITASSLGASSYLLQPNNITNTTGIFTGLGPGTFTISVPGGGPCTFPQTVTLQLPTTMNWSSVTKVEPTCTTPVGTISTQVTGGSSPISYSISPAVAPINTTGTFTNLSAGTYTISATDALNCTISTQVTLVTPQALNLSSPLVTHTVCPSLNNGSISTSATNSVNLPVTYSISPGGTSNSNGTFSGLTAGSYTISAVDAGGCSATIIANVLNPMLPAINNVSSIQPTCAQPLGSITVSASSPLPTTLTYTLQPSNQSNGTGIFTGLSSNVYSVTVTDPNGCSVDTTITLNLLGNISVNTVTSNGSCTVLGSIQATATGGTSSYSYNLMPGNITNTTGAFNSLTAGNYTITAMDANGCVGTTTAAIASFQLPNWISAASGNPNCNANTGWVSGMATSSNGSLSYTLMPGNLTNTTGSFMNLAAGNYVLTATDTANCDTTTSFTISVPPPVVWGTPSSANVSCHGGNDGNISIAASGGTGTITYLLNPGNVSNTTGSFGTLGASFYTITATDANNCSISTTVQVTEPLPLSWGNSTSTSVSCHGGNDGSISISASGGTGTISYLLNPGSVINTTGLFGTLTAGTYTITATDANNCSISSTVQVIEPSALSWGNSTSTDVSCHGGSDGSFSLSAIGGTAPLSYTLQPGSLTNGSGTYTNLSAGVYTVTVTDGNNCSISSSVTIVEPPLLSITAVSSTTPSCVPGNDGSITVTASGGTPAYQYSLGGPSQSGHVFTNVGGGVYTITVTDGNNCTVTSTVSIMAPNAPSISNVTTDSVSCHGGSDGSLSLSAIGGTSPLSYTLQPGSLTNSSGSYMNLTSGSYTVTVTDGIGCSVSTSVMIGEPLPLSWGNSTSTSVSCYGGNDGSISISASGGTGTISYLLNPGSVINTTGLFGTLTAGTYTITATDANNCSISSTVQVIEPSALSWGNSTSTDVSCHGGSDGSFSLSAIGGTAPLSYTLQPGSLTNGSGTYTNLSAGVYTVTVTDGNNCSISSSVTIVEPPLLSITAVSSTTPSCVPGNDGSITVTASGGTPAYQYSLGGPSQSGHVFTNVGGGVYTITVTDGNNCTVTSTVSIMAPNAPSISNVTTDSVSCHGGSDGSLSLSAIGGTSPLSYTLQPGSLTNSSGSYMNLTSGSYTVTVTDGIGCSVSTSVMIGEPLPLSWGNSTSTSVSCYGGNDGSISISASGGTGTISYLLNPGSVINTTGLFGTLTAGTYTITATDANNCSISSTVQVIEPSALSWGNPTSTDVSCYGGSDGSFSLSAIGGTAPLSYTLQPGSLTNGSGTYTNLSAGVYTVTVTDGNNCSISSSVTIVEPPLLSITAVSSTTPSCVPGNDGSITVTASGGTPAYQYSLGGPSQSGHVFTNVGGGVYTITVTDGNNCTVTSTVSIMAPNAPSISNVTTDSVSCHGGSDGSLSLSAIGGTSPLSYTLQPGSLTNSSGSYMNLTSGSYTVTVTDGIGCSVSTSVMIGEPLPLSWGNSTSTSVSCYGGNDGSISISASGGTGTISYLLNPGSVINTTGLFGTLTAGTYTITATDANNCSISSTVQVIEPSALSWNNSTSTDVSCYGGSDGSFSLSAIGGTAPLSYTLQPGSLTNGSGTYTNLSAGVYIVTVTDGNNCSISSSVTIVEPPLLSITAVSSTTPSCVPGNDGSITVTASGGTPAYQYSLGGPSQSGHVFTNVGGGVYTITVTDGNNCTVTSTVSIMAPNAPSITDIITTPATCTPGNDGTISVVTSGGQVPYQYNIGGANQASGIFNGVAAGLYVVTVTDANGCSATSTTSITLPPSPVILTATVSSASCVPGCDGSVLINATGGTSPTYQYSINGINFQTSNTFSGLCTNTYLATIQDGNGCIDTMSFIIGTANGPIVSSITTDSASCFGANDGAVSIVGSNGTPPLNYTLTPGNITNTTGTFSTLSAGNYSVLVSDANGCTVNATFAILEPSVVLFDSVSGSGSSCNGLGNGTIFVSNIGGTAPFTYGISPSATFTPPNTFNNLQGNTSYIVTATDANGCSLTTAIFISTPSALLVSNATTTAVSCNGAHDGAATVAVTGGTTPYSYTMQPNNVTNTNGSFNGLAGGLYTVTITDANNCSATTSLNIIEPAGIQINNVSIQNVTCFGDGDGSIQINTSGGIQPLSYNLQPTNQSNATGLFAGLSGANYTITITDANNCSITTSAIVSEADPLAIDSLSSIQVSCAGAADGQITIHTSGGNGGDNYYLQPINANNSTGFFTNLAAQQYFISVVDTNSCTVFDTILIVEPNPLTASGAKTNVDCFGGNNGAISVTPVGGTPSYTFTLSPGNITNSTGSYTGLTAGLYNVTVVDANNCSTVVSGIDITQPIQMVINNVNIKDVDCYGENTGTITVGATGGVASLQYSLTPSGNQIAPGAFEDLYAGTYIITISDANNCTLSSSAVINQNAQMTFDRIVVTEPLCFGDDNGTIEFDASGGTGTILYAVNNSPSTIKNRYTNLVAGYYDLSARDSLGCTIDSGINLGQPDPVLISSIDLTHLSCTDARDGTAIIGSSGGVGYHTFYIRPGIQFNRSGVFSNLDKGYYTIKIVDTNKCEADSFFTILKNQNPMSSDVIKRDLSCHGFGNEGSAEVIVRGGERPLRYIWKTNPVEETAKITGLRYGWYYVNVLDAKGCGLWDSVYINPGECCSELFIPNAFSPNGDGKNDEFRVVTTAGIDLLQFEIFNRWGQRVWDTYTYHQGWDGRFAGDDAATGTYYYVYRYRCITDGKEYIRKGDIILVR